LNIALIELLASITKLGKRLCINLLLSNFRSEQKKLQLDEHQEFNLIFIKEVAAAGVGRSEDS